MSVGTPKPAWQRQRNKPQTKAVRVFTKEFVYSDKINPFFVFFSSLSLSQLFLRGPQHPGSYLLLSPGRSVISWGVGVRCKSPYSTAPRSPPRRAPKLSERLPPRSVPGPPTQLLLPGSAAATSAATPATAGPHQA